MFQQFTKEEIASFIANAPKSKEEMSANRRAWLFRTEMQEAGLSPMDFADWSGLSPIYTARLASRNSDEPVSQGTLDSLRKCIAERAA